MADLSMVSAAAKLLQMPEEKLSLLLKEGNVPNSGRKWITLQEAAKYAKVTVYTVRRWCNAKLIVWRKLNRARCGRVIVDLESLQSFIMKGCAQGSPDYQLGGSVQGVCFNSNKEGD